MIEKNRWLMALSAVGVHICIGSVYAWSVYVVTPEEHYKYLN